MAEMVREFYDRWAERQANDPRRDGILRWKAANLANMVLRTLPGERIRSICEVGGAEGTVLDTVGELLDAEELVNFELSSGFCDAGAERFPRITFVNGEFKPSRQFDLAILSDIIEHVEDDDALIRDVSLASRFAAFKIPVERCLVDSDLAYRLRRRAKPDHLKLGPHHMNGHLHAYTVAQARAAVARHFDIIDSETAHVLHFYGSPKRWRVQRALGSRAAVWLFGGAWFALGRSKHLDESRRSSQPTS